MWKKVRKGIKTSKLFAVKWLEMRFFAFDSCKCLERLCPYLIIEKLKLHLCIRKMHFLNQSWRVQRWKFITRKIFTEMGSTLVRGSSWGSWIWIWHRQSSPSYLVFRVTDRYVVFWSFVGYFKKSRNFVICIKIMQHISVKFLKSSNSKIIVDKKL